MVRYLTLKVKHTYKYASLSLWGNPTSNTISKQFPADGFSGQSPSTHPSPLAHTHAINQNQPTK